MEYEGTRLRSAETTRSASVREVPLHSSRRVREPSVRQDLIGYVGFAASIFTVTPAAEGRDVAVIASTTSRSVCVRFNDC